MVEEDEADLYKDPPPINPLFKVAYRAVIQSSEMKQKGVFVDFEREHNDIGPGVGMVKAEFDGWKCTLNWTRSKQGSIPVNYIAVERHGTTQGIIGPFANIRTCWHCGLTGWRDKEHTQGVVLPSQRMPGGVWASPSCPNCDELDWWGKMGIGKTAISQDDFYEAAVEYVADELDRPRLWTHYDGQGVHAHKAIA